MGVRLVASFRVINNEESCTRFWGSNLSPGARFSTSKNARVQMKLSKSRRVSRMPRGFSLICILATVSWNLLPFAEFDVSALFY